MTGHQGRCSFAGMAEPTGYLVRRALPVDSDTVGRLLDSFNREYDEPTPGPAALSRRMTELLSGGDTIVLLAEHPPETPVGLAVLRFRPSIWIEKLECYLAELYVVPELRGRGIGRTLMTAAMAAAREQGAGYMDLSTGEQDTVARALYESLGFSRSEGRPDGPVNYYYERDL